ncbi:hypothetical protein C5C07_13955 [Haloferax sp. Atlit-4N]|nr:hypothetical protein C5C07_13955 [Haloferax sp. Atlit-4N]
MDRPKEEFLKIVEIVLERARMKSGVRQATAKRIRTMAATKKSAGESDVRTMTRVIRCLDEPRELDQLGF